ncbi:hypothetical protein Tco_1116646 [Tanacetum coccineum]
MRRVGAFVPIETKIRREVSELAAVQRGMQKKNLIKGVLRVPEEGMNVESLQTKYLIIDWEVYTEDSRRLYDTCGVHHVSTKDGIDIYMLVEKEYPLSRGVLTQMLAAKLLVEQNNEMSRELLRKIFMMAERPRR